MRLLWAGIALLSLAGADAHASERFSCGGAEVEFSFEKRTGVGIEDHVEAILKVSGQGRATVLRYDGNVDFIGGICTASGQSKPMVLFQAYCDGSACKDLDNWGIVDPSDIRVLLVPNDWNRHDAEKILGRPLPTTKDNATGRQFPMIEIKHMISISQEAEKLGLKW
jgi:hypothetical protein